MVASNIGEVRLLSGGRDVGLLVPLDEGSSVPPGTDEDEEGPGLLSQEGGQGRGTAAGQGGKAANSATPVTMDPGAARANEATPCCEDPRGHVPAEGPGRSAMLPPGLCAQLHLEHGLGGEPVPARGPPS